MKDHSMTNTSNSTLTLYSFQMGRQYVAATIRKSENPDGTFDGEVHVYSHLGDLSGSFPGCTELEQQLVALDMAGFFAVCNGAAFMAFDGAASVENAGRQILAQRRARSISADIACELWGDLQFCRDTVVHSELGFRGLATRLYALAPALGRPSELTLKSLSPHAQLFWETIWPELKRQFGADCTASPERLAA